MVYMSNLVVPDPEGQKRENLPLPTKMAKPLTPIQAHCAMLLGQGFPIGRVAERMVDHIVQKSSRDKKYRIKVARTRIRKWSRRQDFRDLMYEHALVALDLESPLMLKGIAKKAKAGRVDAAKLALELTERHLPKGEGVTGPINVIFAGIPRPVDADGEVVDEED